jgi:hypothetical protein
VEKVEVGLVREEGEEGEGKGREGRGGGRREGSRSNTRGEEEIRKQKGNSGILVPT